VAKSYAGPQSLLAPVVVVPYRVETSVTRTDEHGTPRTTVEVQNRHVRVERGALTPNGEDVHIRDAQSRSIR